MKHVAWNTNVSLLKPIHAPEPPNSTWYQGFLRRRPHLHSITGAKMEQSRHDNATKTKITEWFEKTLQPLFQTWNYDRHLIANCDETMVQLSSKRRVKIIIPKQKGLRHCAEEQDVGHITFLSTIFANGAHARTLIIYPQKTLPMELSLEEVADDSDFVVSGKSGGWIDKELFEQYCLQVIIPKFKEQRKLAPLDLQRGLLVVDGHSSRWNPDLMEKFSENNIDVVSLVSHTSHVCQPLDATVFGIFKEELGRSVRRALSELKQAIQDEPGTLAAFSDQPDLNAASMDVDYDVYSASKRENSDVEDSDNDNGPSTANKLDTRERRFVLVQTAKKALYCALWRNYVINSFKTTGIYPLNLEKCLARKGVRVTTILEDLREQIELSKKRPRQSINGIVLTSECSISMIKKELEKASAPKPTPAKRGRKATKKL